MPTLQILTRQTITADHSFVPSVDDSPCARVYWRVSTHFVSLHYSAAFVGRCTHAWVTWKYLRTHVPPPPVACWVGCLLTKHFYFQERTRNTSCTTRVSERRRRESFDGVPVAASRLHVATLPVVKSRWRETGAGTPVQCEHCTLPYTFRPPRHRLAIVPR